MKGIPVPRTPAIWLLTALTAVFCFGLATDLIPHFRGEVEWLPGPAGFRWTYSPPRPAWFAASLIGVGGYAAGAAALIGAAGRHSAFPRALILWSFVGAALLSVLIIGMEGPPFFLLFTRSAAPDIGAYQFAAAMIDDVGGLGPTLRNWPAFLAQFRQINPLGGIAIAPPGQAVIYYGLMRAFDVIPPLSAAYAGLLRPLQCQNPDMLRWTDAEWASAIPVMFIPLFAALGVAPLYRLGRRLYGRTAALWAVGLWPLVPSLAMFTPRFNALYALIAIVALVFVWEGLLRRRGRLLFVAGFAISIGIFLNFALVPMGLVGGLGIVGYGLWTLRRRAALRTAIQSTALNLAWFGAGVTAFWAAYYALTGLTIFEILRLSFDRHLYFLERPYAPWLVLHTWDMYLFVGLPVAALSVWRAWRGRFLRTPGDAFAVAGLLALIIMVLSGTARGETGRVWLFFSPIWILMAADVLSALPRPERRLSLALQIACFMAVAGFLRPNLNALTPVPQPPAPETAPAVPLNVIFTTPDGRDPILLAGFTGRSEGAEAVLDLYWGLPAGAERPRSLYQFALLPVQPDGGIGMAYNWMPYERNYPPSCWVPGRVWVETIRVPLAESGQAALRGEWWFSLSVIDVYTRESLLVGAERQTGIGPVRVP
jgi:hypothetical protein